VGEYERLVEEVELLREIQTAVRQLEEGRGISHEEAKSQIRGRISHSRRLLDLEELSVSP
jgi:hypothetical protein